MNILSDGKSAGIVLFYADENSNLRTVYLTKEQADSVDALLSIAFKDSVHVGREVMYGDDGKPIVVGNIKRGGTDERD
mgnify:FL=1